MDTDDDIHLVFEPLQQFDFCIRIKSGQYPGGMEVANQFAAELQIQFAVKFTSPRNDRFGLFLQIFFVIKADFHFCPHSF